MLTMIVLSLKIIRIKAYTKVWKEEVLVSEENVKLLYMGWILFPLQPLQSSSNIACPFIFGLSGEKKTQQKSLVS